MHFVYSVICVRCNLSCTLSFVCGMASVLSFFLKVRFLCVFCVLQRDQFLCKMWFRPPPPHNVVSVLCGVLFVHCGFCSVVYAQ